MPTLPSNLLLTGTERDEIAIHIVELRELLGQTPEQQPDAEQVVLGALTDMFCTLASTTPNEFAAEARGRAFLMTLDDLPYWAVIAAIKRWYRGNCAELALPKQPFNFHFCPAPAELRRVAWYIKAQIESHADMLQRVLDAEAPFDFSVEHRARMLEKLASIEIFGTPLVGTDGSGGAAGDQPVEGAHCGTQPEAQARPEA